MDPCVGELGVLADFLDQRVDRLGPCVVFVEARKRVGVDGVFAVGVWADDPRAGFADLVLRPPLVERALGVVPGVPGQGGEEVVDAEPVFGVGRVREPKHGLGDCGGAWQCGSGGGGVHDGADGAEGVAPRLGAGLDVAAEAGKYAALVQHGEPGSGVGVGAELQPGELHRGEYPVPRKVGDHLCVAGGQPARLREQVGQACRANLYPRGCADGSMKVGRRALFLHFCRVLRKGRCRGRSVSGPVIGGLLAGQWLAR